MKNGHRAKTDGRETLLKEIYRNRYVYLFLAPGLLFLLVFSYWPMYGLVLAFKDFRINLGILGSPWSNPLLKNFALLSRDTEFWSAFWNTFRMGFFFILTAFPAPILLALLVNELGGTRYKRVLQTIYTFPNFLSWVVVGGLMVSFFSAEGFVNSILIKADVGKVDFLTSKAMIRPILYAVNVWKSAGWSSIMYMAAITGINPELYEAAEIDGAGRFARMRHITWPGIKPTAVILLILAFGGIMNNGFDEILNLTNATVEDAAQVLDTFIYRRAFQAVPNYGFSTAMGLGKSVINFVFLLSANKIAKLMGEGGVM